MNENISDLAHVNMLGHEWKKWDKGQVLGEMTVESGSGDSKYTISSVVFKKEINVRGKYCMDPLQNDWY